ncbi:DUF2125 domain-containing protein [Thalassobius vesicularis]|uniref:DUF2125 domain-containing protein n=1 Tax=Thalassobius vesicularis TaxID=1294297 RepID=A0A4S3MDY6_9RHOB|nr:DUF2125 domain-containing protein [Thalassobius vesicularis]THD76697.1 DUF2125 domain-containing protein [Thalassobius vesicularis]
MKHWTVLKTSAATALCMTGSAGFADVTAQDVWAAWTEQMTQYGYSIKADENMSGGLLSLTNIAMHIDLPEDGGVLDLTVPEMGFRENGDGTVQMVMPASMPVKMHVAPKEGEVVDLTITYATQGLAAVISGNPGAMTHNYTAASAALALSDLVVDGKPVEIGQISMTMTNVQGSSSTEKGAVISAKQRFAADTLDYTVDMMDPKGSGERVFLKGGLKGLDGGGYSNMPEGADMQDMAAAMKAGFGFDGSFSHKGGSNEFSFNGKSDQMQGKSSSGGGMIRVAMDAGRLIYDVMASGVSLEAMSSELPLPISLQMAQAGFKLAMPLMASDAAQDYQVSVTLGDFTMADMLWGIFDPTGQLPRDPATIALDISGQAKLSHDLLDETQMKDLGEGAPGQIDSANINALTVRVAGAELTGAGGFTFDNTDTTSFDGIPRPQGQMNLKLVGGNGLLDKLVAMGFVPEDQAMGARMMMGLFAVPGDGPDTLNSKIEVNAEGHVLANGQRLK